MNALEYANRLKQLELIAKVLLHLEVKNALGDFLVEGDAVSFLTGLAGGLASLMLVLLLLGHALC